MRRLTFIRRCRDFGFPIEQVRFLTALIQDSERPCSEARDLAEAHLAALREKLAELQTLERDIAEFIETADVMCAGRAGADCELLEKLTEPSVTTRPTR